MRCACHWRPTAVSKVPCPGLWQHLFTLFIGPEKIKVVSGDGFDAPFWGATTASYNRQPILLTASACVEAAPLSQTFRRSSAPSDSPAPESFSHAAGLRVRRLRVVARNSPFSPVDRSRLLTGGFSPGSPKYSYNSPDSLLLEPGCPTQIQLLPERRFFARGADALATGELAAISCSSIARVVWRSSS